MTHPKGPITELFLFPPTLTRAWARHICRGGGRQFRFMVGGQGNTVAGFSLIHGKVTN